jgi:uroporphyrin-III C-methyltransferase / precorrin-2 dehydrogenase / sirohydrochlorin ferrochelatase
MSHIPLFINSKNAKVLVIGGGVVAFRKAADWVDKGADVCMISPHFDQSYQRIDRSKIKFIHRKVRPTDISAIQILYLATNDRALHQKLAELALQKNILVNAVDQPDIGNFISPAVIDRNPIQIAIGSGGASPVLVRHIKQKIELLLPKNLGALATLAQKFRHVIQKKYADLTQRRQFWESIFAGDIPQHVYQHQDDIAEKKLRRAVIRRPEEKEGHITLIGAGPGSPDLLTLAGYRALQIADIIYYDALVSEEILKLARKDATFIYVGKRSNQHHKSQLEIQSLLIKSAQKGLHVVRLKGGDPFIFGRGGEEVLAAREKNIAVSVIPGITAASGCAASTQIPLTHREVSRSVTFLTGHQKDGSLPDWRHLAKPHQTLAVYMGHAHLTQLAKQLLLHNRAGSTPVTMIENGSLANEKVIHTTIEDLALVAQKHQRKGPVLTFIGEVCKLAKSNNKPHENQHVFTNHKIQQDRIELKKAS